MRYTSILVEPSNNATMVEPDEYTTLDEPFNVLFELAVNANIDDPLDDGALDEMGKPEWTKEGVGQGTTGYDFEMDINGTNAQANMHKKHFKQVGSDVDRIHSVEGEEMVFGRNKETKSIFNISFY
ncbi:hypothetical protein YC2023_053458 [Brassica napus]